MEVRQVNNKNKWEKFVLSRGGSFLQSWYWAEAQRQMGNEAYCLGLFVQKKMIGAALVVLEKAKRGRYLSCAGGPIIDWKDKSLFAAFYFEIKRIGREKNALFFRLRPDLEVGFPTDFFWFFGFRPAPMHLHAELTWELNIEPEEKEILKNMRKNTRYGIKRAQREGLSVVVSDDIADLAKFYDLQLKTAKRQKFVPFSRSYLEAEFRAFARCGQASLFIVYDTQGRNLAMAMLIFYGERAVYHYGASLPEAGRLGASYWCLWQAIKQAKIRGCRVFDFWGIAPQGKKNHPWQGLTFFKKGFGGSEHERLHAMDLPLSTKYWLVWAFETLRRKKRRL